MKLNMKKLYELDDPLGWDDDIPSQLRESWINLIVEALVAEKLYFPRSARPVDAVGGPIIVGFGDGAFAAYVAVVYLVWQLACDHGAGCEGHFQSSLLCSKARVTPLRGFTIPRSELSGGLLVSRLVLATARALSKLDEKPSNSVIMLDSECVISCLEENAKKLKPFFHNRRGEMLENMEETKKYCPMEDVHHVPGHLNPADIPTRGLANLEDIGPDSLWQIGPGFLCTPRKGWPVTRDFVRESVPDQERRQPGVVARATFAAVMVRTGSVDLSLYFPTHHRIAGILQQNNCLHSRMNVLALVVRGWQSKTAVTQAGRQSKLAVTSELLASPPNADELKQAENMILAHAMLETAEALHARKLDSLLPQRMGALIVTTGRLGEKSMERILGVSALPILMPGSRVAELYMWRAHMGYSGLFHRSVALTLAKSRSSVWIVRGKDLARRICSQCMVCRRNKKELARQQMALLREE